jgi:hypothetical protein
MSEKKTPQEWAAERGYRILDPDGWRMADSPPFDQPCTQEAFDWRFMLCTIQRIETALDEGVTVNINCRSGCKTKNHASWGECVRAAGVQIGNLK